MFERDTLLGPDGSPALELAENVRKQLVDTYKLLHPLMEIRERQVSRGRPFFAENVVLCTVHDISIETCTSYHLSPATTST